MRNLDNCISPFTSVYSPNRTAGTKHQLHFQACTSCPVWRNASFFVDAVKITFRRRILRERRILRRSAAVSAAAEFNHGFVGIFLRGTCRYARLAPPPLVIPPTTPLQAHCDGGLARLQFVAHHSAASSRYFDPHDESESGRASAASTLSRFSEASSAAVQFSDSEQQQAVPRGRRLRRLDPEWRQNIEGQASFPLSLPPPRPFPFTLSLPLQLSSRTRLPSSSVI